MCGNLIGYPIVTFDQSEVHTTCLFQLNIITSARPVLGACLRVLVEVRVISRITLIFRYSINLN